MCAEYSDRTGEKQRVPLQKFKELAFCLCSQGKILGLVSRSFSCLPSPIEQDMDLRFVH